MILLKKRLMHFREINGYRSNIMTKKKLKVWNLLKEGKFHINGDPAELFEKCGKGASNIEIERKFLVLNDSYKKESFSHSHIVQGYICSDEGRTVRIRIRDERAYITIKGPTPEGGLHCFEFEKEITLEEGRQLMRLCEPGIIDKVRWLVKCGKYTFEVDEFFGDNEGLVMAEVELSTDNEEVEIPSFIGKEVTGDPRYFNSYLRIHPHRTW